MSLNLGWFSTGRDEAAVDLFTAVQSAVCEGVIAGRISFAFSNRDPGEGTWSDRLFDAVRREGIELLHLSSKKFKPDLRKEPGRLEEWRAEYHRKVMELVEPLRADVIMLAGYMLIVSPEMCQRLPMINLHPAMPGGPKGSWQEVIWQLIEARATEAGAMIHLVTEVLDEGPPISYCTFPICGGKFDPLRAAFEEKMARSTLQEIKDTEGEAEPLFLEIRAEELAREFPLILSTLKNLSTGKIRLQGREVLVGEVSRPGGSCLNEEIERALAEG